MRKQGLEQMAVKGEEGGVGGKEKSFTRDQPEVWWLRRQLGAHRQVEASPVTIRHFLPISESNDLWMKRD